MRVEALRSSGCWGGCLGNLEDLADRRRNGGSRYGEVTRGAILFYASPSQICENLVDGTFMLICAMVVRHDAQARSLRELRD